MGDFLLLIVGDGIQSGAESLVGFIERYGNMRFGLGLIEVAAYRLPNDELLLQPRILAKTELIQRTVLIGSSGIVEFEQVASKEDAETPKNSDSTWFQNFWSEYLKILRLDDPLQPLPTKPSRSTNIFFSMPIPGNAAWISAYVAQGSGTAGVYLTFSKSFEKIDFYYEQLLSQKEDIERNLGGLLSWERNGNKIYIGAPNISFNDLKVLDQQIRVIAYLAEMTNRMVNVFRHRLEALSRENS